MFASQLSNINPNQFYGPGKRINKADNRFIVDRIDKDVYT